MRERDIVNEVSFPVKLGEYVAAKLPVVINSALIGAGEFVTQNNIGHILDDGDYTLQYLLQHYQEYQHRCNQAVEMLSSNEISYLKCYESI